MTDSIHETPDSRAVDVARAPNSNITDAATIHVEGPAIEEKAPNICTQCLLPTNILITFGTATLGICMDCYHERRSLIDY